jgi:hypothetical protein
MKEGKWLAINFGEEEPTKILKYLNPDEHLPEDILDPFKIYDEEILTKITVAEDNFMKNDLFRLIFVT